MYRLLFSFLFLFFMANAGVKEDVDMIMAGVKDHSIEEYVENGKFYRADTGALFYAGRYVGYSEILNLYFKRNDALTNPYFKINFCLETMNSTCKDGILLCYESQIKASYMREAYSGNSFKLRKLNDSDLVCKNQTHFGFFVSANETHFIVKASLDAHIYVFPIPQPHSNENEVRCFVLNMGSTISLDTTITDMAGEMLIFTGNSPQNFYVDEPFFYKSDDTTMNLWMFFIDFIPYFSQKLIYFRRPFYFRGGGTNCKMEAEFSTDTLNTCKQNMQMIGSCVTVNLDSSDLDCSATLSASQRAEEGTDKQTSLSTTDTTSRTNTTGNKNSSGHIINPSYQAKTDFMAAIGWEFQYTYHWENEQIWGLEDRTENARTAGSSETTVLREVTEKGRTLEMKIHRTDGGSVNLYQLVMECAGDIIRFHKVYAVGDTANTGFPQSSEVYYEWNNGTSEPTKLKKDISNTSLTNNEAISLPVPNDQGRELDD